MSKSAKKHEPVFYVYEHWRMDRDECFYVGKGHGIRAYKLRSGRNRHHRGIVDKMENTGSAVEVRIVASGLVEIDALNLEKSRIAFWRGEGVDIANYTDGGDGMSGYVATSETRQKMSAGLSGIPRTPEWNARNAAAKRGKVPSAESLLKMSLAKLGKKKSPETRAKMGDAKRGIPKTEEHKRNISKARKGIPQTQEAIDKRMAPVRARREERKRLEAELVKKIDN